MLRIKLGLLASLLAWTVLGAQAADTDTLRVDLKRALEIALSDNPTIKIADKEIERVDYSQKAAWGALLPALSASAKYSHFAVAGKTIQFGSEIDVPTEFNFDASVSLSLPIVAPALWHAIKLSALDMQMAAEKARASKITLRNDVTKSYYNLLLAQDSYEALQDGYNIAKQNYELAKQRYENGMAAEYDYISAEVQMNNLLPNLLQVENGVRQSKLYLKVLMGVGAEVALAAEGNLASLEAVVTGSAAGISLRSNADLVQLDIQQLQLQKSLQLQQSQRMPTLAGFGQYGYSGSQSKEMALNFGGAPITIESQPFKMLSSGLIVGVQLSVPIFNGFTKTYKEKQIKIQVKELELQREYVEKTLTVQAQSSLDNMEKAVKQMESNKKAVALAEKGYKISGTRYNNGMGTMLELQSSALALTQSKLSYHQAISDYLSAKADYEKIAGE
ncbi:MAG: TolC family protein [Prevotellaceae bacterium]|jgi:outer membrane protein TolC|nr:TolC family protein [Prevotellaceae bacterium]